METLEQLNAFSAEDFESWLDNRLRKLHDPDSNVRYRAWELAGVSRGCLGDPGSPSLGLSGG